MKWPPLSEALNASSTADNRETRAGLVGAVLTIALTASIVGALDFLLLGHLGFSLWDPGYLWYGVQRVLRGDIPIRDFASYDIGRYYWAAAFLKLFGMRGIVAVRVATLTVASVAIGSAAAFVVKPGLVAGWRRNIVFACAVIIFVAWMAPWWKSYDIACSIALTISLAGVIANPTTLGCFCYGVVIGIAAVIGRNHGLYGLVATYIAIAVVRPRTAPTQMWSKITAWMGGIIAGYSPVIILCVSDRTFLNMFWQNMWSLIILHGATNLYIPIPWPWKVDIQANSPFGSLQHLLVGLVFIAMVAFCAIGIIYVARHRDVVSKTEYSGLVASVCVAISYLNVAFSRADLSHLAQAIFPALCGLLILLKRRIHGKWIVTSGGMLLLLVVISVLTALPLNPLYRMSAQGGWQKVAIQNDQLWTDPYTAQLVTSIQRLSQCYLRKGETVLSAPVWPGVYPLLSVRAPVWDIYPTVSRSASFEAAELQRLKRSQTELVLINSNPLDGRADLLYKVTHPKIWNYIEGNFRVIDANKGLGMLVFLKNGIAINYRCPI